MVYCVSLFLLILLIRSYLLNHQKKIWTASEGLFGEKDDLSGNHMETEVSIYHSSYETSQDFFKKLDTYSPNIVEHEDSTSFVAHEVVTNKNSSLSNTEDAAHEDITSSAGEDDATIEGETPSEAIKDEFNLSTTDNANGYPTNGDATSEETKRTSIPLVSIFLMV